MRGTIKNHERYCIRNPANGPQQAEVDVDDGSGDTNQVSPVCPERRKPVLNTDKDFIIFLCNFL